MKVGWAGLRLLERRGGGETKTALLILFHSGKSVLGGGDDTEAADGSDLVGADGADDNVTSDAEETSGDADLEVEPEIVAAVSDKGVPDMTEGNFVFLDAVLFLVTIHFFNLQHCLKTPGPPLPILSLQLMHSLQSPCLLHPSHSSHLFSPRFPFLVVFFGSSLISADSLELCSSTDST